METTPVDYDNVVATLNFAGTAGETQQFTVATLDDVIVEPTETFTVSLNASDPLVTATDTGTGTLTDNDLVPAVIKRAFLPDGTSIPTGMTIPSGLEFKYLLYINNTGGAVSDVSVRDALDAAFQYQSPTIQVDNSVAACALVACTAAEELTIFTAVDSAAVLSDAPDGDVASYVAPNIDAGDGNAGNLQLDINANMVWAMLFSVKMP